MEVDIHPSRLLMNVLSIDDTLLPSRIIVPSSPKNRLDIANAAPMARSVPLSQESKISFGRDTPSELFDPAIIVFSTKLAINGSAVRRFLLPSLWGPRPISARIGDVCHVLSAVIFGNNVMVKVSGSVADDIADSGATKRFEVGFTHLIPRLEGPDAAPRTNSSIRSGNSASGVESRIPLFSQYTGGVNP
jgi:hypothetical protein